MSNPPPHEGITSFTLGVFFTMEGGGSIGRPTHLMHVVHMGGLDQTIGFK